MDRKAVSGIMLTLLLTSMLAWTFGPQSVEASGTIYIKADGSIDPLTAPMQRDGDIYTLTGNITSDADGIAIERDNMTLDGAGHTVQGPGARANGFIGIKLTGRSNVTIKNMEISEFNFCIRLNNSSKNNIYENNITNTMFCIYLYGSSNNTVSGNRIASHEWDGIYLYGSSNNTISGNNIIYNPWADIGLDYSHHNIIVGNNITQGFINEGISIYRGSNNIIYHNNFLGQYHPQHPDDSPNVWDDGYPSGGNYWNNHVCTGNPSDGSQPYIINENNIDHYPFQDPNGWLLHQLTINSSPITGVAFTIDEVPYITQYTEWLLAGSYTLVMPETHNGYVWSHWLEDGDPNRIKTVTLNTNNTYTALFTLDTTPPTITIVSPENKTYPVNDVSLTFTVSESASWIDYSLDGQANMTIVGNTTLTGLSDGMHSIVVYANDTAGNTGASQIVYFTIETRQPEPFPIGIIGAVAMAVIGTAIALIFLWRKR